MELVLRLRKQLAEAGLDAGAETIGWHLTHHHRVTVSRATVNRILTRAGAVVSDPSKRPKSSYLRFEAAMPNECWQSDFTHYPLANPDGSLGADTEIITWLDDHARYALHLSAHPRVTGPIVVTTFRAAADRHGHPASTLTDNGMVYTTRLSGGSLHGSRGRNGFEHELHRLGIVQKNSRPSHPTTCGKVERFQQTLKPGCAPSTPSRPPSPTCRPSWTSSPSSTTTSGRTARYHTGPPQPPPTRPPPKPAPPRHNVPHPTTGSAATASTPAAPSPCAWPASCATSHSGEPTPNPRRTPVILLIHDLEVRVINAATGEVLRELTIDLTRNYQPLGQPPHRPPNNSKGEPPK